MQLWDRIMEFYKHGDLEGQAPPAQSLAYGELFTDRIMRLQGQPMSGAIQESCEALG